MGAWPKGRSDLVKELEEFGTGLVDGADDGATTTGQSLEEGDHLEAGGAVQATVTHTHT